MPARLCCCVAGDLAHVLLVFKHSMHHCGPVTLSRQKTAVGEPCTRPPLASHVCGCLLRYLLSSDPRFQRLQPHAHSPVTWFRNPYAYLILVCNLPHHLGTCVWIMDGVQSQSLARNAASHVAKAACHHLGTLLTAASFCCLTHCLTITAVACSCSGTSPLYVQHAYGLTG